MAEKNIKNRQNYSHLIWTLAKTDFKMRYHGSVLGYIWAILKPLFLFLILNFVFSQVIGRGAGIPHYSLQLITGLILWNFFAEGTMAGLTSFISKANIVTKIYFPRWIVIIASTLNSLLVFLASLIIMIGFFIFYGVHPSPVEILTAAFYIFGIYILIFSFSLIAAPLYLKFRDLAQIWEVLTQALFFAAPIIYPLSILPEKYHKLVLLNPMGILIHYSKIVLIEHRFPGFDNHLILITLVLSLLAAGLIFFNKKEKRIAENI
ncbi:MAG: ABC transporter permease [Patescibacteria group bacterium]|nr:ABC transporter permease [Patescibacteria group bacterium]